MRLGMVIDLTRCVGCRACMLACKVENGTPEGVFWMYVFRFEEGTYPNAKVRFLPRPCMHCDNPPCVAAAKNNERIQWRGKTVQTDYDNIREEEDTRLIEKACPYGVNFYLIDDPKERQYLKWDEVKELLGIFPGYWNPDTAGVSKWSGDPNKKERRLAGGGHRKGAIEKCTFCVHRMDKEIENIAKTTGKSIEEIDKEIEEGKIKLQYKTACQEVCPVQAISFGDLDDPESEVSKKIGENKGRIFRLKEWAGTNPKVYYIGNPPDPDARFIEIVPTGEKMQLKGNKEIGNLQHPFK